jgi:hypothetical protein
VHVPAAGAAPGVVVVVAPEPAVDGAAVLEVVPPATVVVVASAAAPVGVVVDGSATATAVVSVVPDVCAVTECWGMRTRAVMPAPVMTAELKLATRADLFMQRLSPPDL